MPWGHDPGALAFRRELETIDIPQNKFLLVSIFGASVADFVEAARVLAPLADGFELNMSCPHAAGYGAEIGADRNLLCGITRAVVDAVNVPVFVKFSAILGDLAGAAAAVIAAGAHGITVTNTIGPALVDLGETPVLSNRFGGLSGEGIRPLGVRAVMQLRSALGPAPVIIGMGGISSHQHVHEYAGVGADLFGVGSAAACLDSREYAAFFSGASSSVVESPASRPAGRAPGPERAVRVLPTRLESREQLSEDLFRVTFTELPAPYPPGALAGKFFFIFLPGVGEKPFALFSAAERSVIVRPVGVFTEQTSAAGGRGETVSAGALRQALAAVSGQDHRAGWRRHRHSLTTRDRVLLQADNALIFVLGARSGDGLFGLDEFEALGSVSLATDDGSAGFRGRVHEAVMELLPGLSKRPPGDLIFVNCGPEPMVKACFQVELELVPGDQIYGSIEYMTSCGVGICGKCASPSGALSCIDGPFMSLAEFQASSNSGSAAERPGSALTRRMSGSWIGGTSGAADRRGFRIVAENNPPKFHTDQFGA